MDGGAWWATVHEVAKSWTQLSDFTFFFSFFLWAGELIPKLMNAEGCLTGLWVPPLSRTLRGESPLGQTGSTRPGAQLS